MLRYVIVCSSPESVVFVMVFFFFFQAEDGIRDLVRSRGLEMCIRDREKIGSELSAVMEGKDERVLKLLLDQAVTVSELSCLLYTSDAADERSSVDLGGRRIIKKKKRKHIGRSRCSTE